MPTALFLGPPGAVLGFWEPLLAGVFLLSALFASLRGSSKVIENVYGVILLTEPHSFSARWNYQLFNSPLGCFDCKIFIYTFLQKCPLSNLCECCPRCRFLCWCGWSGQKTSPIYERPDSQDTGSFWFLGKAKDFNSTPLIFRKVLVLWKDIKSNIFYLERNSFSCRLMSIFGWFWFILFYYIWHAKNLWKGNIK